MLLFQGHQQDFLFRDVTQILSVKGSKFELLAKYYQTILSTVELNGSNLGVNENMFETGRSS